VIFGAGYAGLPAVAAKDHRCPRQHSRSYRSHTTTRLDEAGVGNFQARSNTARYGNDGNLVNNPHNRGLATVSGGG
jgi:hypothetical protein